jgi:hypothetical protein
MNPHPLLTWQVSTPTFTPAADAGLAKAKIAATAAPLAAFSFLDIPANSFIAARRLTIREDQRRAVSYKDRCFRTPCGGTPSRVRGSPL